MTNQNPVVGHIDTTLLVKAVKLFTDKFAQVQKHVLANPDDMQGNYVALSECYGLVSGVALEASALSADIIKAMKYSSQPTGQGLDMGGFDMGDLLSGIPGFGGKSNKN